MTNPPNAKAGPRTECTVKTRGVCSGAACALHGVCPYEAQILEQIGRRDPS